MPLINLQTNLKSLRYGADRQGGGDSGLPYITKDINTANTGLKFDDGLVRGGVVNAAIASAVDTARIFKFLKDPPKGPLFIVKQVGLQLSNPRLEIPKNPSNIIIGAPANLLAVSTNGLLEPTRIYNLGINTLAQIPVNAFGGHFIRHGILPIQNEASKYEAVVAANNAFILNNSNVINSGYKSVGNRLLRLATKFDLGKQETSNVNTALNRARGFLNRLATTVGINIRGLRPDDLVIDEYKGGPGSIYGILGSTTINRTLQITNDKSKIDGSLSFSNQFAGKTRDNSGAPNSVNYFNDLGKGPKAIDNYNFNFGGTSLVAGVDQNVVKYSLPSVGNPSIKTYAVLQIQIEQQQQLKNPNNKSGSIYYNQFDIYDTEKKAYSSTNIDKIGYKNSYGDVVTIGISNWQEASREVRIGSHRKDEINLTPLFESPTNPGNYVQINGEGFYARDLVKFRIGAINTDNPNNTVWMIFRAYLTGFQESYSSDWSDVKYVGRGEKFKIYNGFDRSVSFSFKVAALSKEEMKPMYQKLNYLASNMMPDYKGVLMRGPFMKLTIGDYLNAQPGIITSLQYSVTDDTPWEISLDQPEGGSAMYDLPHIISVNMTFIPIGVKDAGLPKKDPSTPVILQSELQDNYWVNGLTAPVGTQTTRPKLH